MLSDLHTFMNRRAKVIRRQSMARLSGPLLPSSFSDLDVGSLPTKPRSSSVQSASDRRQSTVRGAGAGAPLSFLQAQPLAPVDEAAD